MTGQRDEGTAQGPGTLTGRVDLCEAAPCQALICWCPRPTVGTDSGRVSVEIGS